MKPSHNTNLMLGAACCAAGFAFSACHDEMSASDPQFQRKLEKQLPYVDALSQVEQKHGAAIISVPAFDQPDDKFQFSPSATADTFFNDARSAREGSASNYEQSGVSGGPGLNVTMDPVAGASFAAPMQQYQQAQAQNQAAQNFTD